MKLTESRKRMKFTFEMKDAWGDDYTLEVVAETERKARSIANMIDDDAVAGNLLGVENDIVS